MIRSLAFSALILGLLALLVPLLPREPSPRADDAGAVALADRDAHLDVVQLRRQSRNRNLRFAADQEITRLQAMTLGELVVLVGEGTDRERSLAAAVLGASGRDDVVLPLSQAFELEDDPRVLESLAIALAETRRTEALETLIRAIRNRDGIRAYKACRALKDVFGVELGLDADAWDRWLVMSRATRD